MANLKERCSDDDEMKFSHNDLARCNEEKICTDNFKDVMEMTMRIAMKEMVENNQKDAMLVRWYPQIKVEKSQAQWKN